MSVACDHFNPLQGDHRQLHCSRSACGTAAKAPVVGPRLFTSTRLTKHCLLRSTSESAAVDGAQNGAAQTGAFIQPKDMFAIFRAAAQTFQNMPSIYLRPSAAAEVPFPTLSPQKRLLLQ